MTLNEIKLLNEVNAFEKKVEKMNDDILKKCVDCSQHTLAKVCPKCPLFPYFIIFHLDHNGKI